jgi:hypothetical protein
MPRAALLALTVLFFYGEVSAAQLQLSWTDNSGNENGFKIERGPASSGPFTQIGTVASNVTSYTDIGLADATTFCYRVRAYNTVGDSSYTNTACATTGSTLTLAKAGSGGGTITSNPAGISCGSACSASYASGTSVTLTAAPATGSVFTGWSGACSGTGSCVVTMSAARSVTATFAVQSFSLNLTKAGTGSGSVTSSPAGINCGSTCSANFNNATSVTLTPTAGTGSTFAGWGGACSGTGSCVVSMTAAKSVTATFNTQTFALTTTKSGTGVGTITSAPAGINCGTTCSVNFNNGTSVTLTATAAAGSTFAGWTGACTGTGACVVTVNAAKSVNAAFNVMPPSAPGGLSVM